MDYFVGRALYTQENKYKKRLLLVLSLIGNLGMLCFFKYGSFLLENFVALTNATGYNFHPAKPNIILPAGISFYTFTTLCYTIDMYKRKSKPVKSLLDFSLFVTFFPHLVAGPIVRPPQLVPQFEHPRKATRQQLMQGLFLLSLGFYESGFGRHNAGSAANTVFGSPGLYQDSMHGWVCLLFPVRYFLILPDIRPVRSVWPFVLGFVLPENFRFLMRPLGLPISGEDGISRFRPGFGTIYIFRSVETGKEK